MNKYIFLSILIISSIKSANACVCRESPSFEKLFDQSKIVFLIEVTGNKLTAVETNEGSDRAIELNYEVIKSYKNGESKIPLFQLFDSCSLNLNTGTKYVVFVPAKAWHGVSNVINQCTGSFPVYTLEYSDGRINRIRG